MESAFEIAIVHEGEYIHLLVYTMNGRAQLGNKMTRETRFEVMTVWCAQPIDVINKRLQPSVEGDTVALSVYPRVFSPAVAHAAATFEYIHI